MNNIKKYIAIIFTYCLLLISCSDINPENIIYFGISQKPQNLDPRFQSDAASERISALIYSPLFYFNKKYELESDIVNWKKISPLKYKFKIKNQLPLFNHNKAMGIEDIVATLNNLRTEERSPFYIELNNIKSVNKLSKSDFEINLYKKDNNFCLD